MGSEIEYAQARKAAEARRKRRGGPLTGRTGIWLAKPGGNGSSWKYIKPRNYGRSDDGAGGYRKPIGRKRT